MAVVPSPEALVPQRRGSLEFSITAFAPARAPDGLATSFPAGARIFWRARFSQSAAAMQISVVTVLQQASGWEEVVSGTTMWLPHPEIPGYAGWIGPGAYAGPGTYVLRVVAGRNVLAEGTFTILESSRDAVIH